MHEYSIGNRNSEKVVFKIALIAFILLQESIIS